jgi:predicted DNA-binding mobile mystery protein A
MNPEIRNVLIRGLDEQIPSMQQAQGAVTVPMRGWLRAIREALGMTQKEVGVAMGMRQQAYRLVEGREMRGAVTIETLRRAAGALDCELVYFLMPRQSAARTFGELAAVHDPSRENQRATEHSMALEGQDVRPAHSPKPGQAAQ